MSHELRTPINAMLGYTALMREEIYGALNDKQEGALRKIYGASQHLLALINDILDLSRIEAGKMPIRIEEVRLGPIVHELSQAMEPMVREKRLEYRTELADDLPVLMTDRTKVKQILLNLLTNAVKFTAQGSVTLRAHLVEEKNRFRMEVEDTGIGIEQQDLEAIFDDFRQVDQSSTRQVGGTGLGLSITRKLVSLLRGRVHVESEYGRGSVFAVELPVELIVEGDVVVDPADEWRTPLEDQPLAGSLDAPVPESPPKGSSPPSLQ
jgi:signal transduction histidine kinase